MLSLHRKSKTCHTKGKRSPRLHNHHFSPRKLQSIEEEEATGSTKVDVGETLDSACDDSTDDDKRRAILLFLGRKFKSSGRVRRDASQKRSKTMKIRPPMNIF